jgi:hypothetical protein
MINSMTELAALNPALFMQIVDEAQNLYAAGYTFTSANTPEDVFQASDKVKAEWEEFARLGAEQAYLETMNEEAVKPSHGYTYINKDGEEVWTEDFEESIGE